MVLRTMTVLLAGDTADVAVVCDLLRLMELPMAFLNRTWLREQLQMTPKYWT
jgi:hypothetical protein